MSLGLELLLKVGIGTLLDIGSKDRCWCRPVILKLSLLCTELCLVLLCLFCKLDVRLLLLRDITGGRLNYPAFCPAEAFGIVIFRIDRYAV